MRHGTALGFARLSWHDAKFSAWEHGDHDDVSRKRLTQSPCCLLWSQRRFAAAGDQRAWSVSGATCHGISPPWRHFASHRRGIAHRTMSQLGKVIFKNGHLPQQKRAELFETLVPSKYLYGADSWVAFDHRTMSRFQASIFKLYRRILRLPADHLTTLYLRCFVSPAPWSFCGGQG